MEFRAFKPLAMALALTLSACGGDSTPGDETGTQGTTEESGSETATDTTESGSETATSTDESGDGDVGDGDGDTTTGDGDTTTGDGDTSTGDGDTSTGDGDSATTGDGDGDGGTAGDGDSAGDGDGDGDSGGDGDSTTTSGDGDSTTTSGDGDSTTTSGDGDSTTTSGDGDSTTTSGDGGSTTSTTSTTSGGDGDTGGSGECGNGVIEAPEECDDSGDSSTCSELCLLKTYCQSSVWECGDGIDNDNDGFIDGQDTDCFGPCDNNEGGWKGLIPGQADDCQVDCYFDDDNGNGTDLCKWSFACDPLMPQDPPFNCEYEDLDNDTWGDENVTGAPNTYNDCEGLYTPVGPDGPGQDPDCFDPEGANGGENICGAITPPGCDCFGCCAVPTGDCTTDDDCEGAGVCDTVAGKCVYTVYLGSVDTTNPNDPGSCNADTLKNPEDCHPCTQVASCLSECNNDNCELCFGQTEDDLPDECNGNECEGGLTPCDTVADCPQTGTYACITGCCVDLPL